MAGILGVIPLNNKVPSCTSKQFDKIMSGLRYQDSQPTIKIEIENVWIGKAGMVNEKEVNIDQFANKVYCVCEGDIHVLPDVKKELLKTNPELTNAKTEALIPTLFKKYGKYLPEKLSGNFNIFCFDSETRQSLIFNGRFGMLPLFYYANDQYLIFASKISSIIKSGLVEINWDYQTQLEQIIFNYPISEHSLIAEINSLPAGNMICLDYNKVELKEYWSISKLFGRNQFSKKESFEVVYNGFEQAIYRGIGLYEENTNKVGLSLTGGWDGRLVLSYLLKKGKTDNILLYSFGAEGSADVTIPKTISEELDIPYERVLLNNNYIENDFLKNAKETILLSNGYRPFLRTHYLYTMKLLSSKVGIVLSGNCGSNILKFGLVKPGTVVSGSLLSLINSSNKHALAESLFLEYYKIIPGINKQMKDDFMERVDPLINILNSTESISEAYYSLLFKIVERKFFGTEQNSYNDFIYNFSPFIDYQLINALSQTMYWGANYPFNSNSLKLRKLSTDLYSQIIKRNSSFLWKARTDRDVSFKDLTTIAGMIKILQRKYFAKKSKISDFNTQSLMSIFKKSHDVEIIEVLSKEGTANLLSTEFLRSSIQKV